MRNRLDNGFGKRELLKYRNKPKKASNAQELTIIEVTVPPITVATKWKM